jgi:hypothetical protein
MGTLQTELLKLQTLDNLSFDDDAPGAEPQEAQAPEQDNRTRRMKTWEYLRDHPMSSAHEIIENTGFSKTQVLSSCYQLYQQGALSRQKINGHFHYSTTSTTYPFLSRQEAMKRAWATRTEMAKAGTLAAAYADKRKDKKPAAAKPKTEKPVPTPTATVPPAETVPAHANVPLGFDPGVVHTWPLSMARLVYVELKKYFGEV